MNNTAFSFTDLGDETVRARPQQGNPPTGPSTQKRSVRTFIKGLTWRHLLIACLIIALIAVVIAVSVYFGKKRNTAEAESCFPSPGVRLDYSQDANFVAYVVLFWPWSSDMNNSSSQVYDERKIQADYLVKKIFQSSSRSSCITCVAKDMVKFGGNTLLLVNLNVTCESMTEGDIQNAYEEGYSRLLTTQDKSCVSNINPKTSVNSIGEDTIAGPSPISSTICGQSQLYPAPKIVGGQQVHRGQYPWVVMLLRDGRFYCGGTIWDYDHILTAAHCVPEFLTNNFTGEVNTSGLEVIAGKWESDVDGGYPGEQRVGVAAGRIYVNYSTEDVIKDIAILKLNQSLEPTQLVMKVCHPTADATLPEQGIVAGWGNTHTPTAPDSLLSVQLTVFDHHTCAQLLSFTRNTLYHLPVGTVCAIGNQLKDKDSCNPRVNFVLIHLDTMNNQAYSNFTDLTGSTATIGGEQGPGETGTTREDEGCISPSPRVRQDLLQDPDFGALLVFFWPWSPDMEDTNSPMYEETISKAEYWVSDKDFPDQFTFLLHQVCCDENDEMHHKCFCSRRLVGNILVILQLSVSCDSAGEIEINRAYIEGHALLQRTQDRSCVVNISKNIYLQRWRKNITITDPVPPSAIPAPVALTVKFGCLMFRPQLGKFTRYRSQTPQQTLSDTICGQSQLYPVPKIVGGRPAKRGQYPWVVKLDTEKDNISYSCGGTIWDYNHILTAAHCIEMLQRNSITGLVDPQAITVTAGKWESESNLFPYEQQRSVASARIHTGYYNDNKSIANDIALLKLAEPLHPTQLVMKVCHPHASTQLPKKGIVAGWGQTKDGQTSTPEVQQSVELSLLDQSDCEKHLINYFPNNMPYDLANGSLCAIDDDLEERDSCQGDSGGPLFANLGTGGVDRYTILGIVSYGDGCGKKLKPGVYASVQYYLDWIQNTILFLG
ncbi:hypothetical protein C0Q70_07884 [Pomacea canaliculata]|uniref:Peptidase S1 domain-containing protein n=1 Tax=Pomacea canaliculata TaxID=400727 RepID=A0A2T7PG95_POMCA|nr:hypothetical protein C0Q70_07884 [Pomacea canaliculata]